MDGLTEALVAPGYEAARWVLQRGVGVIYLLAFLNVRNQFPALLGETGLLPVPEFLARHRDLVGPSVFRIRYSDRILAVVAWAGMALAAGIVAGIPDRLGSLAGMIWWLAMWALYLSIVNVGQTFYAFGWESLLLEAGFYAAFLGNGAPPWIILLAFRWLLFRVEFGAGMIKLRGDPCWRDLTCLYYHHETQPMPGPLSAWFHFLPRRLHRAEVAGNHFAQLVAPFALFLPQPGAGAAAVVIIVTQGYLMISGNYSWLNLTTLLLAFAAVPDQWFGRAIGGGAAPPDWLVGLSILLGGLVLWLSRRPLLNLVSRRQLMNYSFNRFHLVNAYGAFGSVTRRRRELIIEGSEKANPGPDDWRAYEFKGKPGDPHRRPPQWAPYHLRLDWLLWFVPLSPQYARGWLDALLQKLAEADPRILALLHHDPFSGRPPRRLRALMVDYRFAAAAERKETGRWWVTSNPVLFRGPFSIAP